MFFVLFMNFILEFKLYTINDMSYLFNVKFLQFDIYKRMINDLYILFIFTHLPNITKKQNMTKNR